MSSSTPDGNSVYKKYTGKANDSANSYVYDHPTFPNSQHPRFTEGEHFGLLPHERKPELIEVLTQRAMMEELAKYKAADPKNLDPKSSTQ
ncbi:hypothetical protein FBU30_009047 [Linnemannia zychae]|nr:hypothetical protein FBU30_009047 [Linnemannia zychae]